MSEEIGHLDAREALREISDAERQIRRRDERVGAVMFAVWGLAWVLGFGAAYLAYTPSGDPLLPLLPALVIAGLALVAAIVFSAVFGSRQGAGERGPSTVVGAIIGNAYLLAFLAEAALGWRLSQTVAGAEMTTYWVVATCLVVGGMGGISAAFGNSRAGCVFGGWTLAVGFVAALVPPPGALLVGACGGLGFLAMALMVALGARFLVGPIVRVDDD